MSGECTDRRHEVMCAVLVTYLVQAVGSGAHATPKGGGGEGARRRWHHPGTQGARGHGAAGGLVLLLTQY
jgi:hypothetical protein